MEGLLELNESAPLIITGFVALFFFIATILAIMLVLDFRKRKKICDKFFEYSNEYVILLSMDLKMLSLLSHQVKDYLLNLLQSGKNFKELLNASNRERMEIYFKEIERHADMPFLFPIEREISEMEKVILWYEMRVVVEKLNAGDKCYSCFIRNITKENELKKQQDTYREQLDFLLKNTGDFLWETNVEERRMQLLTPILDETHQIAPHPVGKLELSEMCPLEDILLLDELLNERIKVFKRLGYKGEPIDNARVRFYGANNSLIWYNLRSKLTVNDLGKVVLRGSARRLDSVFNQFSFKETGLKEYIFASLLDIPDVRIFWVDKDYHIMGCNQAFVNDFKKKNPEEAVGKPLDSIVQFKYYSYMSQVINEVFVTLKKVSSKKVFLQRGRLLMLNALPLGTENKEVKGVLAFYILLDKSSFINDQE